MRFKAVILIEILWHLILYHIFYNKGYHCLFIVLINAEHIQISEIVLKCLVHYHLKP